VFKSTNGLITVTETKFEALEQNFTNIVTYANNLDTELKNYCFNNIPRAVVYNKEPVGVMEMRYQKEDLTASLYVPNMSAEVIDW
jgi:hypothetical protein